MLSLTVFFTSSGVFRVGQVLWCKGTKKNCDLQIFCPKVAVFWAHFPHNSKHKKVLPTVYLWYMLWYMSANHIPCLKPFAHRHFSPPMVYGIYIRINIRKNQVGGLPGVNR